MSYTALIGFLMMLVIVVLLLKQKVSTIFSFAIIPIIAAILIGAKPDKIGMFLTKGFAMTIPVTLIMLFSLPYFMMMADTGLFNGIVRRILKHVKLNAPVLMLLTLVVAMITGLDVSITSVFLITVPLLLPFYKRLHLNPVILVFLTTLGCIETFDVPWSARILRSASLLTGVHNAPISIFSRLLPSQLIFTAFLVVGIVIWGIIEQRRINQDASVENVNAKIDETEIVDDEELGRSRYFWWNVLLTVLVIVALVGLPTVPSYYIFAVGLVIGLSLNYPNLKLQNKLLKKYASSLFPVAPAILLSGVVVGVLEFSGMMKAMVETLVGIIPMAIGPWIYILVAIVSVPLMFLFTNDTWYYVLMPIIISLMRAYGVPAEVVIVTLFMNMGAMLTPIAQPQIYIGTDLTDGAVDLQKYVKFSFIPIWGLSLLWIAIGLLTGAFR